LRRDRASLNNEACAASLTRSAAFLGPETRPVLLSFLVMDRWWSTVSGKRYPVLWIGKVAVVTLPAEVDVTNADSVREELLSVVNEGAVTLIADMSTTTFCDSAGVSALVRTFRRATASGGTMKLVVDTPAVHRVLAITGVDRLVEVCPSVAASLGGLDGHRDREGDDLGEQSPTAS
jgi:anti-sigma B factor antagonist